VQLFADKVLSFFTELRPPDNLPVGIEALYPQQEMSVKEIMKIFFNKYFSDTNARYMLIGINPGRFGAGITGINFTAARQLREDCGIEHDFGNKSELSAEFIYSVIRAFGGVEKFYSRFYFSSISPIGFTRNGKNLNYYDDPILLQRIRPYAVECLKRQLAFGCSRKLAICIGGDKNTHFLTALNNEFDFFDEIHSLPHPRYIMQYNRKELSSFRDAYLQALESCSRFDG
jgi:hypothetical protein